MVQVQHLWTSIMYGLEILHQCGKSIKTKSQKVLETSFYVCKSSMKKKLVGEELLLHENTEQCFGEKSWLLYNLRSKKLSTSWKLVEGSPWQKNSCPLNLALLTEVQYVLALLRTIIRTILRRCSRLLCLNYA